MVHRFGKKSLFSKLKSLTKRETPPSSTIGPCWSPTLLHLISWRDYLGSSHIAEVPSSALLPTVLHCLTYFLLCFFAPTSNPLQLPSYSSFHFGDKGFIHKPIKITLLHDIFVSQQVSHKPLDWGRFSMVKVECLHVFVGFKNIPLLTSSICEIKSWMTQWELHAVALMDYNTFFLPFVCWCTQNPGFFCHQHQWSVPMCTN